MGQEETARRYPLTGGIAALRLPVLAGVMALGGIALGAWDAAAGLLALGLLGASLWRGFVVEVSAVGLTRGFVLKDRFLGGTTIIPWPAVAEVRTEWCRPGEDMALETLVRGRDGTVIRLTTSMGLGSYWACLAAIVHRAPGAVQSGLTLATLADGPPTRRETLAAVRTAGALALVLVALVGMYYVWAQGRSYLARYLEESGAVAAPERCAGPAPFGATPGKSCR
jgi:hypothetical protein